MIATLDFIQRHLAFGAVGNESRFLWRKIEQGADGASSLVAGAQFQDLA